MINLYIGVDIGATKIDTALVSDYKIIKKIRVETKAKSNKTKILNNIITTIKAVYTPQAKGIGVGIAGKVNQQKGIFVSGTNFDKNFKNVNLNKILSSIFKRPVMIDNDANCFTLGEAIAGVAKKYHHVIGLTLGTGVGGGIVINKKIYHGKEGSAGELGHMIIKEDGLVCGCGQLGHLESYASGLAMSRLHKKLTGHPRHPLQIEAEAKAGNKKAQEIFKIMSQALAVGLANIIHIFNPDVIVIGGSLAKVETLVQPAIKLVKPKLIYPVLAKTKIITTKPGSETALLGPTFLFKKQ